ncbi:unnamed protein product [Linum tenue]|uniref:Uncharacterized protein n=1 Tax=Linum tenue TaxID=586396 RepID=A0AAV0R2J0_9ROSI|nr:unnamed protein product [Linum tenue]
MGFYIVLILVLFFSMSLFRLFPGGGGLLDSTQIPLDGVWWEPGGSIVVQDVDGTDSVANDFLFGSAEGWWILVDFMIYSYGCDVKLRCEKI